MARKLAEGSSKCFWSDVKGINNTRVYSNIVGLDEPEKICDLWTNHYSGIFNSLGPSNEHVTPVIDPYLNITIEEVVKSVSKLSSGKAAGLDGVTAENIKFAHPVLFFHIFSHIFSGSSSPSTIFEYTLVLLILFTSLQKHLLEPSACFLAMNCITLDINY